MSDDCLLDPPLRYRNKVCGCGEIVGLHWTVNPYLAEIEHNFSKRWMCRSCIDTAEGDI